MAQPNIQSGSIASYVGFYSTSPNQTRTISVTVGAGTNRTLFVAVAFNAGSSVSVPAGFALTYGGVSLSLVGTYGVGASGSAVLFKLDDPTVGTADLVAGNPSASALTSFTLVAFVADGLNGSGRISALINSSAIGLSSPKTTTIAATGDDITVYLAASPKSDIAALGGQTPFLATGPIGISSWYCNFSYKPGASSSAGISWASGGTTQVADAAIVLKGTSSALAWTGTIASQSGTVGTAISALATSSYVSGGTTPYTYSATGLPPGLSINASTGSITGTPTTAGSYSTTVSAVDSAGSPATVSSAAFAWTISAASATAITMTGPSGGQVGVASAAFTVGANGSISGSHTVTPSDGGAGGTFTPTTVTISAGTPTATFTYTPSTTGARTISATDAGGYTAPGTITYTASATAGTLTSSPLKNNTGTVLASVAFEAYVSNPTTGALVVKKTGLTSNGSGVVSFSDGAVAAATSYRVVWRRTDTGAEGLETLTGT